MPQENQVEGAAQFGNDQVKVSKLLAGQIPGFSIERLVHFLSLLGPPEFTVPIPWPTVR
jgi:predicted XRE-type DNA-binding protein